MVALDDLPDWLPAWCLEHLGGEPAGVLFRVQQISMVFGLRLAGGTEVVVKARADDGRAVSCVAAQARLAERGFPCARPLTPAAGAGSLAVHAEEFRPGGEVLHGDAPDVAVPANALPGRNVWGLAGLKGHLANLAACPDGTPVTDDFVIGPGQRHGNGQQGISGEGSHTGLPPWAGPRSVRG